MRRTRRLAGICAVVLVALPGSALGYSRSNLMDDAVMSNVSSMSLPQIEALLSHSPCVASYTETGFHWDGAKWTYGESWSAAKIIYEAAQFWGLNPQVIITKLQQEESLVTGSSCDGWRYASALGYACPDNGSCNPKYAGFTKQVLWGSWQLKFNQERSQGHVAWDEDGSVTYYGLMLKGVFARCEGCVPESFSGYATIDGQEVYLETGATASLYSYTPHLGFKFDELFEAEFGFGSAVAGQVGLVEPEAKKEPPLPVEKPVQPPPKATETPATTTTTTTPAVTAPVVSATATTPPVTPVVKPKPKARRRCHTVVRRIHGKKHRLRVCKRVKKKPKGIKH